MLQSRLTSSYSFPLLISCSLASRALRCLLTTFSPKVSFALCLATAVFYTLSNEMVAAGVSLLVFCSV